MRKLHLICNAHIDPIWQWTWDEGIAAAIATFKSAADLCDEFDYIFCHNEAILYEAIEKYAPDLFERIRAHVKSGKWKIIGGWYLQPDCLMPSGETFVRQIAVGREYFKEKFDTVPTVAVNFDSFGHSVGLVQILKKNGFRGYLACRPRGGDQFAYPSRFYEWVGPDGSSVIATQTFSYNNLLGEAAEKIKKCAGGGAVGMLGQSAKGADPNASVEDVDYVLWGVGNHGGGPSRRDLRDIARLNIDGVELIHSSPEELFDDNIRIGGRVERSLVTCMPGCYSSMARIKQGFRRAESLFYATEKLLAAASLCGLKLDSSDMREAEKRLLLATFHDTLPGTVIEEAEREAQSLLGSVERTLRDKRTHAFLYLTLSEPVAKEGEFPVFVFNYMPYTVSCPVEVEFSLADQNWSEEFNLEPTVYDMDGNPLPSQTVKEGSTLNLDWRKRVVFDAPLSPLGISRFSIRVHEVPKEAKKAVPVSNILDVLKYDKYLTSPVALELYDDTADPWGMSNAELLGMGRNPREMREMDGYEAMDFFAASEPVPPVRIIEDGDVYTATEALYALDSTRARVEYLTYKNKPYTDISVTVEFADKNKLVRVRIPVPEQLRGIPVGDGPYVWEKKPTVGEITFQKWVGVMGEGGKIFAVINDSTYSGKVEDGYIYLTLVRGAGYCFHPIGDKQLYPEDRYLPRIDMGRYVYNLRLFYGTPEEVSIAAEEFAQPPYAVNVFPTGGKSVADCGICVEGELITPVVKESDGGYVLRLYNPSVEAKPFTVRLGTASVSDTALAREVLSVIYKDGKFEVSHGAMPV